MKHLLLLRHAKSSWGDENLPDRERPLSPRGETAAERMGEAIAGRGLLPDHVLCSPALRTRQTLARLEPQFVPGTRIDFIEDLYSGDERTYAGIIQRAAGDAARLLVIGHNPRTQATAVALVGKGERAERIRLAAKYPTAALAVIAFEDGPWNRIAAGSGRLEAFVTPRDLDPTADDD